MRNITQERLAVETLRIVHAELEARVKTRTAELKERESLLLRLAPDHSVLMSVSDDGIGISPTLDLENMASLGVQLVMTLVEQLEGRLEIIRRPRSTFLITFPLESRG